MPPNEQHLHLAGPLRVDTEDADHDVASVICELEARGSMAGPADGYPPMATRRWLPADGSVLPTSHGIAEAKRQIEIGDGKPRSQST